MGVAAGGFQEIALTHSCMLWRFATRAAQDCINCTMIARVYKSTGSWYLVKDSEGNFLNARIKGKFKIDDITSTNPIAVGDLVDVVAEPGEDGTWVITVIHNRKNYINRQSPANRNRHQIIASNIDQSLLVATLREPRTSQGFIDRFLVACEAYHVPAVILFNKSDLYRQKEKEMFAEWEQIYTSIGYRVLSVSTVTGEGIGELKNILQGKTTLMSGHSGVGKSTLINVLMPDLALRTKAVSGWSGKGMHTTTFAEMYDLPEGGSIIDTPGVREFGLVDIGKDELSHFFPEMRLRIQGCQFNNCRHMNEPDCAVKSAVEEGAISIDRYISYCTMLDGISEVHR
jgi:ribosome biogenesis GTPase